MIIKRPKRKAKFVEGTAKVKLVSIEPHYGVLWFDNPEADVVDLTFEFPDGENLTQRETLSFHENSNFAKLIKAITGDYPSSDCDEFDADSILGKEVIGKVEHYTNKKGDTYEKLKDFQNADSANLSGVL